LLTLDLLGLLLGGCFRDFLFAFLDFLRFVFILSRLNLRDNDLFDFNFGDNVVAVNVANALLDSVDFFRDCRFLGLGLNNLSGDVSVVTDFLALFLRVLRIVVRPVLLGCFHLLGVDFLLLSFSHFLI
jgi:hypothetical protein